MKKIKKVKKVKKIKTKKLVSVVAPKKRGRPRKEKVSETPKRKRGRPRKTEAVAVAPKKRGRPKKIETKQEKLTKIAKLGKRNYKKAVEEMAMEKINKRMRRKGSVRNGNGTSHGVPVSVKTYSYEKQSRIVAGPNIAPEGIKPTVKKVIKDEMPILPIEDKIKSRLKEQGYNWKADTFKVVEKASTYWVSEFTDKKQGEITSYVNVIEAKALEELEKIKNGKIPKLSKVELNRYVKKLIERGLHPKNIKIIENTPLYFRIEFNDGDSGSVVTCGHVKGWEM